MLLTPQEDNLGEAMRYFVTNLAKYLNGMNGRINHIFAGRYSPTIITDENHFINTIRYLYQNPVEAGIVKHPYSYKYSSLGFYTGRSNEGFILKPDIYTQKLLDSGVDGYLLWKKEVCSIMSESDSEIVKQCLSRQEFKFTRGQLEYIAKKGSKLCV